MPTTTNYGWTTPADTDLVKDGAAAIRTLGTSIDTTTKALNPSTTLGDIEYRSSTANTNTRLPIGTSGQYLTVSGGVPAWTTFSGGGKLLQVVSTQLTAPLSVTTNGTARTFDDATGFSATITPSSASSKVLVLCQIATSVFTTTNNRIYLRLMRGSTEINVGDSATGVECSSGFYVDGNDSLTTGNMPLMWLDNPATTSATTYKIQHASNFASQVFKYNQGWGTPGADTANGASQILLLEIGA